MRLLSVPRVVALPLALASALGVALLAGACARGPDGVFGDSLERELQADATAIQDDKAQMDHDQQTGNAAFLLRDRHKLYLDTEKQEHDRGTEDDEFAEGEWQ